ncbi:MAG: Beta-Casp domain protein [Methanomassiliicoccales archaeon PtaU1.Bin124]|nr:MAG: Beta-Casp domain protein [Methanomassiliicoccales archaeon PtaU1.Bin124]
MKIQFLGGAEEVGRLGMLLKNKGASMLIEYGFKIMSKDPANPGLKKAPEYPMASPPVDYALLTHSHIDHSGMLPWLCGKYGTKVFATPLTINVSELLWYDSLKVADAEGYDRPYHEDDIEEAVRCFEPIAFGQTIDIAGYEVEAHSAGHIPGATMYELRGEETTLFTGDLNTYNSRLVYGAHPVKCDNLIIESTYAGRPQRDRLKEEQRFVEKVKEVVERGGKAIVPCFAVGRTQEVMLLLKNLKYDMWVDGMGKTVNRMYMDMPEYLRNEKDLRQARKVFGEVRTPSSREKSMNADVIVTTSGMLDGGPVLRYLMQEKENKKSAVLIPGYQAEGSNGRLLLDKRQVTVETEVIGERDYVDVRCEVDRFDLSAHADHNELIRFIKGCKPENVIFMHGDHRDLLAKELEGQCKVFTPMNGQEIEL